MNVAWYIHHHGLGHLRRYRIMRDQLPGLVGLSSLPRPVDVPESEWVALPDDAPASSAADLTAGGILHWAPLRHAGMRERMATIAAWAARWRPDVLVVDVSVEVALFARLMGVPIVWVGQRGQREDAPHRLAFSVAQTVVPWTAQVPSPGGDPAHVRHVGALSRFDGRPVRPAANGRRVLLVLGHGGHTIEPDAVAAARAATPQWTWTTAGVDPDEGVADGDRLWELMQAADVIVGSAGTSVVSEVAAARRPFICLPQPRPFDEQLDQAQALTQAGLAETALRWPTAESWPQLLARAQNRDSERWSLLHDGHGAARMATAIRTAACA